MFVSSRLLSFLREDVNGISIPLRSFHRKHSKPDQTQTISKTTVPAITAPTHHALPILNTPPPLRHPYPPINSPRSNPRRHTLTHQTRRLPSSKPRRQCNDLFPTYEKRRREFEIEIDAVLGCVEKGEVWREPDNEYPTGISPTDPPPLISQIPFYFDSPLPQHTEPADAHLIGTSLEHHPPHRCPILQPANRHRLLRYLARNQRCLVLQFRYWFCDAADGVCLWAVVCAGEGIRGCRRCEF